MQGESNIDESLIFSETSLTTLPDTKFKVNSWIINDDFMFYCAGVLAASIFNLAKLGYFKIQPEKKSIKLLGIALFSQTRYLIQSVKRAPNNVTVGWLEDLIFKCFRLSQFQYLDKMTYEVFHTIFQGDKNLTNPGKVFFVELLKNQRVGLFEFTRKANWLNTSITVWQTKKTKQIPSVFLNSTIPAWLKRSELKVLRDVIEVQLRKFQQLD